MLFASLCGLKMELVCIKFSMSGPHYMYIFACIIHLQGEDDLTCYTFNTHKAQHLFCRTCGVQSFYKPRSNPDGVGVMPHCLDEGTVKSINMLAFDGKNWEKCMKDKGEILKEMSRK